MYVFRYVSIYVSMYVCMYVCIKSFSFFFCRNSFSFFCRNYEFLKLLIPKTGFFPNMFYRCSIPDLKFFNMMYQSTLADDCLW